MEVCGTIDELNSVLGLVRAESSPEQSLPEDIDRLLERVQHQLFAMSADLAVLSASASETVAREQPRLGATDVAALEEAIDCNEAALMPLEGFILPTGPRPAAGLHVARTVCRRAERRLVTLARQPAIEVPAASLAYLNRLSDLLFVLARSICARANHGDALWRKDS